MVNPVAAGFVAGGILARNAGPRAAVGGGIAFAAFSGAIDLFLRRETAEYVFLMFNMMEYITYSNTQICRIWINPCFRWSLGVC